MNVQWSVLFCNILYLLTRDQYLICLYCLYIQEGFWYRALPLGVSTGAFVYYMVRTGKLKPNAKFGATPKVITSAFVAYWSGKLSYILGDACKDKFLRGAPESETAYYIRKERGLSQPWTAIRDFGSEDNEKDGDGYKIELKINKLKIVKSINNTTYSIVNTTVKGEEEEIALSEKEEEILKECSDCSNFLFSLPLSIFGGALMFGAQKKGLISDLSVTKFKWINKLPKVPFRNRTFHGILLGYILGLMLYLKSSDCGDRFLEQAPDGEVARHIRQKREGKSNSQGAVHHQDTFVDSEKASTDASTQQTDKDELFHIDPYTTSSYLTNYSDISSINWFEESQIEIPEKYKK